MYKKILAQVQRVINKVHIIHPKNFLYLLITYWYILFILQVSFFACIYMGKEKNSMSSGIYCYPARIFYHLWTDTLLQIPRNMNYDSAEKKHSWKHFISAMAPMLPLQSLLNLMGLWGQERKTLSACLTWDNSNNSKNAFFLLQRLSSERLIFSSQKQHLYSYESLGKQDPKAEGKVYTSQPVELNHWRHIVWWSLGFRD